MLSDVRNQVDLFNSDRRYLQKLVKDTIKNVSLPLDDRWELFMASMKILEIESYGDGFIDLISNGTGTLYDDFNCQRGETMEYDDMIEWIVESKVYDTLYADNLIAWKEAVLNAGYAGFRNDW